MGRRVGRRKHGLRVSQCGQAGGRTVTLQNAGASGGLNLLEELCVGALNDTGAHRGVQQGGVCRHSTACVVSQHTHTVRLRVRTLQQHRLFTETEGLQLGASRWVSERVSEPVLSPSLRAP
jgi:hypothetical protein